MKCLSSARCCLWRRRKLRNRVSLVTMEMSGGMKDLRVVVKLVNKVEEMVVGLEMLVDMLKVELEVKGTVLVSVVRVGVELMAVKPKVIVVERIEEMVVELEMLVDVLEVELEVEGIVLVSVVGVGVELMAVKPEVIVVERIEVEVTIDSEVLAVELELVVIVVTLVVVSETMAGGIEMVVDPVSVTTTVCVSVTVSRLVAVSMRLVVEDVVVERVVVEAAPHVSTTLMLLVTKVTAPVSAMREPSTFAPVLAVTEACARIMPLNVDPVPSDADDPTCQMTLHAWAPLIKDTLAAFWTVSVVPIWKTNKALGSPWASRRRGPAPEIKAEVLKR